jgi:N-acetylneuraminic acid mutarotase
VLFGIQPLSAQVQGQWMATGSMQSPREANVQVRLSSGNVLSVGGVDNNGNILASAEIYSRTSGVWQSAGRLQTARETFPAVVLPNGKVLVVGGLGTGGTALRSAELYDASTGRWTSARSLSVARFGHTATLLANGKVLVTGGCTAYPCSTLTAVSELYNPTTNTWSTTGSLNTALADHTAVRLKTGKVLVIDGVAAGVTSSCELYDPATGTWSNAASTNVAREQHGTAILQDGKVLVTGGVISRYPMNSAELYDPASNAWTPTGKMANGRYAHTSTLLPDGTVLVAGGEGRSISCGKDCVGYIPTASAEIFNEAAGGFTSTTGLNRALAYHSTTLLSTGRALTAGGIGYNAYCCQVVNDAELYTPLTLTFTASALNFGVLQIGLTSSPQTVTVTNLSNHSSTFARIATSGDYAQSNNCPSTLNPGRNCAIRVTFTPTAAGTRNGTLMLKDNDPGSPTQSIILSGTGETTTLRLVPASLDFGGVIAGSSRVQGATLVNDGVAAVNITRIAISPANRIFSQSNNCPATLSVQQTCTFEITFTPPDVFTYSANLSVISSRGGSAILHLSGTGLDGG